MKPLLQVAFLLAVLVTCSLASPSVRNCTGWKLPESFKNQTMANLLKDFNEEYSSKNHSSVTMECRQITVRKLIAYALNTTGNMTNMIATALGLADHSSCLEYLGFTLKEVAFQNFKDPAMFPGDLTVNQVLQLLFSNTTLAVVHDVNRAIKAVLNKSVDVKKTIQHLTKDGHFNPHSQFLEVLSMAVNASDLDEGAALLDIDKDLLVNTTFLEMAEHLSTTVGHFKKNLSLACAIRHLHSAKHYLKKLQQFQSTARARWGEKTVMEMFVVANASLESTTILSVFKKVFNGSLDIIFLQFFGRRKVSLELFDHKVKTLTEVTFMSAVADFTIKELFVFIFTYENAIEQFVENKEFVEKRRQKIFSRYGCDVDYLMNAPSNLTQADIDKMKELELENYAIECFFKNYTDSRNITLVELETMSGLANNSLKNSSVDNFVDVLYEISKANIMRAIKDKRAVMGIITDYQMLCTSSLREKIVVERQPLVTDWKDVVELKITYLIFRERWNITAIYSNTIFQFLKNYLKAPKLEELANIIGLKKTSHIKQFERALQKYSFKDLTTFYKLKNMEIYDWTFSFFFKFFYEKVENDVNECRFRNHPRYPCARIDGVQCVDFPGGAMCKCPPNKNLDEYRGCEDINECVLKSTDCHNHSHCVNTDGSYKCTCNPGFQEIAKDKCEDIDECTTDPLNRCVFTNANCKNTIGSYTCSCKAGSRFDFGNGVCVDINECQQDRPCKAIEHSYCEDEDPFYRCKCRPGFKEYRNTSASLKPLNCTDIDECTANKDACHEHAICKNTLGSFNCSCKEGYVSHGSKCKAERFFVMHQMRWKSVEKKYAKVEAPLGVYFGGKTYYKLYIYANGKISIDKKYGRRSPKKISRVNKNVLFPFWASAYLSGESSVRYWEIYSDDAAYSSILTKINKFVSNSTKLSNFKADWVLIVNWNKLIPPYKRNSPSPYWRQKNTFQAVVATSGSKTVVLYFYEDSGMTWDPTGRKAVVGYAVKNSGSKGFQVDESFTDKIFRIDGIQYEDPAGNQRQGVLVMVFQPLVPSSTPKDKCLAWVRKATKEDNNWLDDLPKCPCSLSSMEFDSRFIRYRDNGGVRCYVRRTWSRQKTKSCCYYTGWEGYGGLVPDSDSRAGRAFRYSPFHWGSSHQNQDIEPFNWCCEQSSDYCGDFKQLRPADEGCSGVDDDDDGGQCDCRWRFGFRRRRRIVIVIRIFFFGFFFGDPHITTLDGFKYSFNGLGEYVVLETLSKTNRIHGRTKRPPNSKTGGPSMATVFSGFSMMSEKNTTVQVLYSESLDGKLSITSKNESAHCSSFGMTNLQQVPGFFLRRSPQDNTTLEVVFDSGLVAKITPGMGFLQISFLIPGEFFNKTRGLLGKMNNDKSDDMTGPNGTTISTNSTEKEIFEYGQKWKVPDAEAMFVDGNCSIEPVFFNASFTPMFLSDCNVTARMRDVCSNNTECLLDYCLTGDEAFANATTKYEKESEKIKKIVENLPPVITVKPSTVHVKAGENFSVTVTAKDPNDDATTLSTNAKVGALKDGKFSWAPPSGLQDGDPPNIEFIANDTGGAVSVKSLKIRYCDCKNGGVCDFNTTLRSFSNSSLKLVGCKCAANASGDLCDSLVQPCADSPCFGNVSCTVKQEPFGFTCGPCPPGHVGDGEICSDLDECLNASTNNCTKNEKCTNIVGSFKCSCKPGFRRDPNSNNCTDIDECNDLGVNMNCKENTICLNTPGSYKCKCKAGFNGDPHKGCQDINECKDICLGHECKNTIGSFKCKCKKGFELKKKDNKTYVCKDIDECEFPVMNNCSQNCKNILSKYTCSCKEGFKLNADQHTCSVDPNKTCHGSHGCEYGCTNTSGVPVCHCRKGFNLTSNGKNCEDINECEKENGGCMHKCVNTGGSYQCRCKDGYRLKGDKMTCEEMDKCKDNNGGCSQKCEKRPGGQRRCSCKRGYKANDTKCEDIDECAEGKNKCSKAFDQVCRNLPGGHRCRCKDREKFSNGKAKCRKSKKYKFKLRCRRLGNRNLVWKKEYEDEFSEEYESLRGYIVSAMNDYLLRIYGEIYYGCSVLRFWQGSVMVDLSLNFNSSSNVTNLSSELNTTTFGNLVVDPTLSAVSDIDECADNLDNCHANATCKNEPGTFSCQCKEGYEGDGVQCKAVPAKDPEENKDDKKTLLIILLCTLIPLAVIIIIVIIWCCCRRKTKGDIYVSERRDIRQVSYTNNRDEPSYYEGSTRRGSDHDYEIPDNAGMYDLKTTTYYDNPAAVTGTQEAKL